jgi:hypothetical protein
MRPARRDVDRTGRQPEGEAPRVHLLSEASAVDESSATTSEIEEREFNAKMVVWHDGVAERGGLGCVKINASSMQDMTWKKFCYASIFDKTLR